MCLLKIILDSIIKVPYMFTVNVEVFDNKSENYITTLFCRFSTLLSDPKG